MGRGERFGWIVIGVTAIALVAMASIILIGERRGDWIDRCVEREGDTAYYDCSARVPLFG